MICYIFKKALFLPPFFHISLVDPLSFLELLLFCGLYDVGIPLLVLTVCMTYNEYLTHMFILIKLISKVTLIALAGVAQWIECLPVNQGVTSSIK